MRAIVIETFGGPEVLELGEVERPKPGRGQVLIRVAATSVNRADTVQRTGNYPAPPGDSEILGLEVAGTLEETGPGVRGWSAGDRVMTLVGGGGYAEFALAHASHLMPIPDSLSFEQAAAISEVYITAYLNVFMLGALQDGESVLLHGGGGGVNTAGIQLAKTLRQGSRVLVTASPGKIDRVRDLGADVVINYRSEDFAQRVRSETNGGADVILDHIGAPYLSPNLACLAKGGRLVLIGVMKGAKAELNLAALMVKRQRIIGSVLRSRTVEEKAVITAEFTTVVLPMFADKTIEPLIHAVLPLSEAAEAHRMMEASEHFGKVVLKV
jgi:putative PIG3 family NAD(P)H quinone oxidoreductase